MRVYLDQNWLCGHCGTSMERFIEPHTKEHFVQAQDGYGGMVAARPAKMVIFCPNADCPEHDVRALMPSYTEVKPLRVWTNIRVERSAMDDDPMRPDGQKSYCLSADRLDNLHVFVPFRVKDDATHSDLLRQVNDALKQLDTRQWDTWKL